MILTETPRRKMLTKLVTWGHWFALSNIIIALVIAAIYVFASPLPGSILGNFFLLVNWFSHIGLLTFFGFVIFVLPLIYGFPHSRFIRGAGATVAAIGLALLAFDALLYTKYGLHLSFGSAELIRTETATVINTFGWQQWGFLLLLFIVWLSFQLILGNALWRRIDRFSNFRLGVPISAFFVTCFVASHALHVWADANLYQPIIQQDNLFPLSYPATAKTLMSKYGMLDIDSYKQRKALQFNNRIGNIKHPANPVYCSIDNTQNILMLIQVDSLPLPTIDLARFETHFDISASDEAAVNSSLFGLPEVYLPELSDQKPLLLELPARLGLPILFYSNIALNHQGIDDSAVTFDRFKHGINQQQNKLAIGFVTATQLQDVLSETVLSEFKVIISQLSADRNVHKNVPLLTNIDVTSVMSSHLDLAPTILTELGCSAPTTDYSVGQAMQAPIRNWVVGTNGSKVIVLHSGLRIEVTGNGNYKIYDQLSNEETDDSLNTGLLGQAMKHLTRFMQ